LADPVRPSIEEAWLQALQPWFGLRVDMLPVQSEPTTYTERRIVVQGFNISVNTQYARRAWKLFTRFLEDYDDAFTDIAHYLGVEPCDIPNIPNDPEVSPFLMNYYYNGYLLIHSIKPWHICCRTKRQLEVFGNILEDCTDALNLPVTKETAANATLVQSVRAFCEFAIEDGLLLVPTELLDNESVVWSVPKKELASACPELFPTK